MLILAQWGEFAVKNATLYLHIPFWHFLLFFYQKTCVFMIFISFFDEVMNSRNRILANQKPE